MKVKLYFVTLVCFLLIDSLWLGLVAPGFYRSQIGFLLSDTPVMPAAGIFYLLFVFGLVTFVIEPGMSGMSMRQSVVRGALFGLVTYGTYDLTNFATIAGWPFPLTVVDMIWGTALNALVTVLSIQIGRRLL